MNLPLTAPPALNFDRLRRIQATLSRRGAERDGENVRAIGFTPQRSDRPAELPDSGLPVTAQFDVLRKLKRVSDDKRIEPVEAVRLLDRDSRQYHQLALSTAVRQTGEVVPTGVRVGFGSEFATTSLVVRWTTTVPVPALPTAEEAEDPRWRWGLLSVSHLFATEQSGRPTRARVERRTLCGVGPAEIQGRLIARGRVPGGPDVSIIETGLDRLWLSGFLIDPSSPSIVPADEPRLLQWVTLGTNGSFLGDGVQHAWTWQAYYPVLAIDQLGKLEQVIRYEVNGGDSIVAPFGPGSSGGVVMAGGIPIGLHVAAMRPDYRVGFAQTFQVSLAYIRKQLRASTLQIVSVLVDN